MNKKLFILRDSTIRDRLKVYLDTLSLGPDEKPLKVTIEPYKANRSLAQNNLMWLWLTALSNFLRQEHGLDCTPEDLKDHFQRTFLGWRSYEVKDLFSDKPLVVTRQLGTSELKVAPFTEFINEIEIYANNAGLQLAHPEDIYYEAMGFDKEKHRDDG